MTWLWFQSAALRIVAAYTPSGRPAEAGGQLTEGPRRKRGDHDGNRASLAPLDPVDALRALLAVDPDAPPVDEKEGESEDPGGQRR